MQITALIQVINYLKTITGDPALLDGYKKLSETVRDASTKTEEDLLITIIKEKEQLVNRLLESDPVGWGYASYSLFDKINVNKLFGRNAADNIEKLITPDNEDYKGIYSALEKKIKLLSKLSDNLNREDQLLDQVIPREVFKPAVKTTNKSSLLLYFEGHLSVYNVDDLERYSRLWSGILSTFSKLTGEENLSLDITNFSNNNLLLSVSIEDKTISALAGGVSGIVNLLPLILKIRKIQSEILNFSLYNDLNDLLEEEIKNVMDESAWTTSKNLSSSFGTNSYNEEDMTNELFIALKQILSFIEKGGKIEFAPRIPDPEISNTNKILIESTSISIELLSLKEFSDKAYNEKVEQYSNNEGISIGSTV
jgi:hypothetical protein